MKRFRFLFLVCLFGFSISLSSIGELGADVFHLTGGGRVEGELLNPEEKPRAIYIVKTSSGGTVTLNRKEVDRVEKASSDLSRYHELLPRMPNTAEGNLKMAKWCTKHRLDLERDFHYGQVILHDPDHKVARRALGYTKADGRWLIPREFRRDRGEVRYKGKWMTSQELVVVKHLEAYDDAKKAWGLKLKKWRGWIGKKRGDEAIAEIRAIRDPLAVSALKDLLKKESNPRFKMLLVEVLGKIPGSGSTFALADVSLNESDQFLREKALDELASRDMRIVVTFYLKGLTHKENHMVNRAGVALARVKDQRTIAPLIEALTTNHKFIKSGKSGGPGQVGAGFGSDGSTGFSAGNKPKVFIREFINNDILQALVAQTGENFQYDKPNWRAWYVRANTPTNVDLRRRD